MARHEFQRSSAKTPTGATSGQLRSSGGAPLRGTTARRCPHCGKTFQGQTPEQCPACFLPTGGTQIDTLDHASPRFSRLLSWGAALLAFAIPLHTVGIIMTIRGARSAQAIAHMAAALLVSAGVYLLTMRDARFLPRFGKTATRARIWATISTIIWLILAYFALVARSRPFLGDWLVVAVLVIQAGLGWEMAAFCRYVALRVPDDSLSNASYNGGCAIAFLCLVLVIVQLLGWNDPTIVMFLTWPLPITPWLIGVLGWSSLSLARLAAAIHACANEARNQAYQRDHPRKIPKYEAKIDL